MNDDTTSEMQNEGGRQVSFGGKQMSLFLAVVIMVLTWRYPGDHLIIHVWDLRGSSGYRHK